MNLAAMMLVGETGLARLQASVPRSRSLEMSAIVARTTISGDGLTGPQQQDVRGRVHRRQACRLGLAGGFGDERDERHEDRRRGWRSRR